MFFPLFKNDPTINGVTLGLLQYERVRGATDPPGETSILSEDGNTDFVRNCIKQRRFF